MEDLSILFLRNVGNSFTYLKMFLEAWRKLLMETTQALKNVTRIMNQRLTKLLLSMIWKKEIISASTMVEWTTGIGFWDTVYQSHKMSMTHLVFMCRCLMTSKTRRFSSCRELSQWSLYWNLQSSSFRNKAMLSLQKRRSLREPLSLLMINTLTTLERLPLPLK